MAGIRWFIISPDNVYYRLWCYFLTLLSAYTCSVSILQWSFLTPQAKSFLIVDNVINALFMIDMFATFFVAYIDDNICMTVDNPKKIAINYSIMCVFDFILWFPFELVGLCFPPSSQYQKIFNAFRFVRIFRFYRVYSAYLKLEKSDKINFTFVRTVMIIMVTCFVSHWGACIFYYTATWNSDARNTWIGSQRPLFPQEKWWKEYCVSIYWAVVTLTTVGYGDWHAVSFAEMSVSVVLLFFNLIIASYITGYVTNWMSPGMGKIEEYKERRRLAESFCNRHCLTTPIRDEIFSHLRLEYNTELHGFHYNKDDQLLQSLPTSIKTSILHHLCQTMSNSHLFEEVSPETQFQLVQAMEVVSFPENASIILQNDIPMCFYFILAGSVDLIIFENGIEQVAGKIEIGNFVGESCVFSNKPQMFTVKTTQITQFVKMDREKFIKILERNPTDGTVMLENHIKLLKLLDNPYFNRVIKTLEYQMAIGRLNVPVSVWFAAEKDYGQLFYRLLRQQLDPNEPDNKGRTPLHIVASRGDLLKVTHLCQHGADPNLKDLEGNTVLHVAVDANRIDIVHFLLEHGADRVVNNTDGNTPFQLATLHGHHDIQNLLAN